MLPVYAFVAKVTLHSPCSHHQTQQAQDAQNDVWATRSRQALMHVKVVVVVVVVVVMFSMFEYELSLTN